MKVRPAARCVEKERKKERRSALEKKGKMQERVPQK